MVPFTPRATAWNSPPGVVSAMAPSTSPTSNRSKNPCATAFSSTGSCLPLREMNVRARSSTVMSAHPELLQDGVGCRLGGRRVLRSDQVAVDHDVGCPGGAAVVGDGALVLEGRIQIPGHTQPAGLRLVLLLVCEGRHLVAVEQPALVPFADRQQRRRAVAQRGHHALPL